MKHIKAHNIGFLTEKWNVRKQNTRQLSEDISVKDRQGGNWDRSDRSEDIEKITKLKTNIANLLDKGEKTYLRSPGYLDIVIWSIKSGVEYLNRKETLSRADYSNLVKGIRMLEAGRFEVLPQMATIVDKYSDLYNL